MTVRFNNLSLKYQRIRPSSFKYIGIRKFAFQGTLVPKLTLGPFLTLIGRNGHKLKDWGFRIPAYIESKSQW